jgi:hypothetical protein
MALRAAGSAISDVIAGSRIRPDGDTVTWQCAFPPRLGPTEPPFLIEHELSGTEWGEDARGIRAAFVHPFGGSARLVGIEIVVPDPKATAAACAGVVGVPVPPGPGPVPGERETRIGEHGLRLVPASVGDAAPSGPIARVGISATAGDRVLRDLVGVRFARL